MNLSVECRIETDGRIIVRRIRAKTEWEPVEQGRQWQDERGRHVLIMRRGRVHTLTLHPDTLTWTIHPSNDQAIV